MGYPALMIRPPESPVQQLGQVQQVVAGQQQIQAQQLENVIRQRQLQDQDALTKAMASWDGKTTDPGTLSQNILKAGGSGAAAQAAYKNILGLKAQAADVAKNEAATNLSTVEATQKQNDENRGRLLNIVAIKDPAQKQAAWDAEVTKEEQSGQAQPGSVSHTYPGDDVVTAHANRFALGSELEKEAQEKQKLSLDAWKNVGGQLVNAITQERIGGLMNVEQLNNALKTRWQVLHPGEDLPDQFSLKATATPEDFNRVDKLLEATEKGAATKAQQEVVNAMRQQTFEMQREKTDMNPVVGIDPKTGNQVLVPAGQAQQMGVQNVMKADADMVNKALAARHWLNLANKQADPKAAPEDMGIMQLIDKLDKEDKLGPIASRWNEFMTGKVGAGDPDVAALRAKMGLSTTLLMQAHVGSRGSAQMLEHFEDLANQKKLDGPTLKAALGAEVNYVQDKAMDPNPPNYSQQKPSAKAGGGQIQVTDPQGGVHTFKDQASADKFKKLAGIQ